MVKRGGGGGSTTGPCVCEVEQAYDGNQSSEGCANSSF